MVNRRTNLLTRRFSYFGTWESIWVGDMLIYSDLVYQDFKIISFLNGLFKKLSIPTGKFNMIRYFNSFVLIETDLYVIRPFWILYSHLDNNMESSFLYYFMRVFFNMPKLIVYANMNKYMDLNFFSLKKNLFFMRQYRKRVRLLQSISMKEDFFYESVLSFLKKCVAKVEMIPVRNKNETFLSFDFFVPYDYYLRVIFFLLFPDKVYVRSRSNVVYCPPVERLKRWGRSVLEWKTMLFIRYEIERDIRRILDDNIRFKAYHDRIHAKKLAKFKEQLIKRIRAGELRITQYHIEIREFEHQYAQFILSKRGWTYNAEELCGVARGVYPILMHGLFLAKRTVFVKGLIRILKMLLNNGSNGGGFNSCRRLRSFEVRFLSSVVNRVFIVSLYKLFLFSSRFRGVAKKDRRLRRVLKLALILHRFFVFLYKKIYGDVFKFSKVRLYKSLVYFSFKVRKALLLFLKKYRRLMFSTEYINKVLFSLYVFSRFFIYLYGKRNRFFFFNYFFRSFDFVVSSYIVKYFSVDLFNIRFLNSCFYYEGLFNFYFFFLYLNIFSLSNVFVKFINLFKKTTFSLGLNRFCSILRNIFFLKCLYFYNYYYHLVCVFFFNYLFFTNLKLLGLFFNISNINFSIDLNNIRMVNQLNFINSFRNAVIMKFSYLVMLFNKFLNIFVVNIKNNVFLRRVFIYGYYKNFFGVSSFNFLFWFLFQLRFRKNNFFFGLRQFIIRYLKFRERNSLFIHFNRIRTQFYNFVKRRIFTYLFFLNKRMYSFISLRFFSISFDRLIHNLEFVFSEYLRSTVVFLPNFYFERFKRFFWRNRSFKLLNSYVPFFNKNKNIKKYRICGRKFVRLYSLFNNLFIFKLFLKYNRTVVWNIFFKLLRKRRLLRRLINVRFLKYRRLLRTSIWLLRKRRLLKNKRLLKDRKLFRNNRSFRIQILLRNRRLFRIFFFRYVIFIYKLFFIKKFVSKKKNFKRLCLMLSKYSKLCTRTDLFFEDNIVSDDNIFYSFNIAKLFIVRDLKKKKYIKRLLRKLPKFKHMLDSKRTRFFLNRSFNKNNVRYDYDSFNYFRRRKGPRLTTLFPPMKDAKLLCDYIVYYLNLRVRLDRIFSNLRYWQNMEYRVINTLKHTRWIENELVYKKYPLCGIRILCSGSFKKGGRKRRNYYHLWIRNQRLTRKMPLQTIEMDIDYFSSNTNVVTGTVGVKVWLCFSTISYRYRIKNNAYYV